MFYLLNSQGPHFIHRSKGRLINMEDRKATNEKVVGDIGASGVMVTGFNNSSGDDNARGDSDHGSYGRNNHDEYGGGGGSEVGVEQDWG